MPRSMTGQRPADFASAAMVRVLVQGMADLGLPPPAAPAAAGPAQAHVTLDAKRALLQHAVVHGGLGCLPLLGRGIRHLAQEPLYRALTSACDADDLLRRWSRLEAYVHGRHRVEICALAQGEARLRHVSLLVGVRPQPAESLVVLGLIAALFEEIGMHAVRCEVAGTEVFPRARPQALARFVQCGHADAWRIRWEPPAGVPAPSPRHCAAALPDLVAAETWPAVASQVFDALVAALPAPPDVNVLARQLAMSPRQLQRRLQQAGLRYSGLLAEARYRCAGWWLLHSALPLAEVGFLSGHADQPHLTRTFKQRSGMTPQAFRSAFAASR